MKKIGLMVLCMLMLCTFSACSNEDDPVSIAAPTADGGSSIPLSSTSIAPEASLVCTIDDMGMNQLLVTAEDGTQFSFSYEGVPLEDGVELGIGERIKVQYAGQPGEESFRAAGISAAS